MVTIITIALLTIGSIYLAGRNAERRGRSFKNWAWVAAVIGPFALLLVCVHARAGKDGDRADRT
jgi:hypothetical protein